MKTYNECQQRVVEVCNVEPFSSLETAKDNAIYALSFMDEMPHLINPTDESILFEWWKQANKFSLEFYNDGDICFLQKVNEKIHVEQITKQDLMPFIQKIA